MLISTCQEDIYELLDNPNNHDPEKRQLFYGLRKNYGLSSPSKLKYLNLNMLDEIKNCLNLESQIILDEKYWKLLTESNTTNFQNQNIIWGDHCNLNDTFHSISTLSDDSIESVDTNPHRKSWKVLVKPVKSTTQTFVNDYIATSRLTVSNTSSPRFTPRDSSRTRDTNNSIRRRNSKGQLLYKLYRDRNEMILSEQDDKYHKSLTPIPSYLSCNDNHKCMNKNMQQGKSALQMSVGRLVNSFYRAFSSSRSRRIEQVAPSG